MPLAAFRAYRSGKTFKNVAVCGAIKGKPQRIASTAG
jgi:hypothetical protein